MRSSGFSDFCVSVLPRAPGIPLLFLRFFSLPFMRLSNADNLFHFVAFSSYGAFWLSFSLLYIPGSGIAEAYTDSTEFASAVGIYLFTWFIVTFLFLYAIFSPLFDQHRLNVYLALSH